MRSKNMNPVAYPELALARKAEKVDVPMQLIERQSTMAGAIALCVQVSGLEDKEVYLSLGIDAGHWSRIMKGDAHFPVNKLCDLMDLCGNEAPLKWLASHRGYGLVMLKTEAQRRIEELESQLNKERERRIWAEDMATGRRGGN
ncbi:transcriptional regulator [Pusillimonas minor]|uniref:Transcriptional regulator n=1 Tax=Pusillimonas minor TaxID=2697024 RepID=A0A842HM11_9BURK|nr:transcriptional regulator [Pusillimonas minor]MBC2768578.1 transcriptional regulator [Pusillimonas minor]